MTPSTDNPSDLEKQGREWLESMVSSLCDEEPSDIAYSADQMVDAFIAGASHRQASIAQHEGGRGEPEMRLFTHDERPLYAHPPTTRPAALSDRNAVLEDAAKVAEALSEDASLDGAEAHGAYLAAAAIRACAKEVGQE